MQTIGERLEEARKRKGISLREAADATKIRTDFLHNFESNQFEFDLPDIYRRGFLRIYARYLGLNAEKLLADFSALQLGGGKSSRKESREFYGQVSIDAGSFGDSSQKEAYASAPKPDRPQPTKPTTDSQPSQPSRSGRAPSNFKNIYKIVGAFSGACALLAVAFFGIKAVKDMKPTLPKSLQDSKSANYAQTSIPSNSDEEISLIATGNVHVIVRQESDKSRLFNDNLAAGERVSIKKKGMVKIHFTEGSNLKIERGGQVYEMDASGAGVRVVS